MWAAALMIQDEADGEDWRSVSTRVPDDAAIGAAHARAREPGHGRTADRPTQIPVQGWRDILLRVFWAVPRDRVLSTAGGVAFFALLSTFPGLATIVSVYSLFLGPERPQRTSNPAHGRTPERRTRSPRRTAPAHHQAEYRNAQRSVTCEPLDRILERQLGCGCALRCAQRDLQGA